MTDADPQPKFLSPDEVSSRYGGRITARTLANWRLLGKGPPFSKIGGRVLYPAEELAAWEKQNTVQSTSEHTKGSHHEES